MKGYTAEASVHCSLIRSIWINTPVWGHLEFFFFFKVNLDKNHRATLLFDDEQMLHVGDFVEEERALCIVAWRLYTWHSIYRKENNKSNIGFDNMGKPHFPEKKFPPGSKKKNPRCLVQIGTQLPHWSICKKIVNIILIYLLQVCYFIYNNN